MTEKILVFGALGRMGSAIIANLPETADIRAADIARMAEPPVNVEPFLFDFNNPPADLAPLFADVKRMFLLWPPGVDVKGALSPVIEAAAQHGVKQVVFLSILGADKLKVVPHRSVEQLLEDSGMNWVFLRSAYFMQNLSGMHAPEIRDRDEIFLPAGKGDLGMVDVRDVAEVGAKALIEDHRNVAYSLTGGEALTFAQAAGIFSQELDRPIRYTNPPTLKFSRQMRTRGVPGGLVIFMVIEYLATKLGKSGKVTNEIENQLSRPPRSLAEFVSDHAEVWQR